jgi:hypothetical protein
MVEYWYSPIAHRWLAASKATGRLLGQYATKAAILEDYPWAVLSTEMGE